MRKTPLQTVTIVLCLSIGSTLTVVVFGVINAMIGGELPGVRDRGQLVRVEVAGTRDHRVGPLLGADYRVLSSQLPGLSGWGSELGAKPFSVSAGGQGGVEDGAFVSGSYFSVLGTAPALGRLLGPGDDRPDAAPVVVIGHQFWQRRFGGRPDVLGSSIEVTTGTFVIVGVAPPGFTGIFPGDLDRSSSARRAIWLPLSQAPIVGLGVGQQDFTAAPAIIARLGHGVSREDAASQLQILVPRFNAARAESRTQGAVAAVHLRPFHLLFADDDEVGAMLLIFGTLTAVPLIILGIACANVAGVQLARAIGRTHELAVRVSLGASRGRVARLLALETGMLAIVASAFGWLAARELLRLGSGLLPFTPIADVRVFLFALALPVGVTFLAGFLPAWRATGFDVLSGLRLGPRVGRAASPRVRRSVVAAQIALSVALMFAAGALIRGLGGLPSAVGRPHNDVLVAEVRFWDLGFDEARERSARAELVARVRTLVGVDAVALSPRSLFLTSGSDGTCWAGTESRAGMQAHLGPGTRLVSPNYFDVLRLSIRQGRGYRPGDDRSVVVVNEAFARTLPDPGVVMGSLVSLPRGNGVTDTARIIGVVEDNYERFPGGTPRPRCFPLWDDSRAGGWLTIYVRTSRADELVPVIQGFLRDVDPRLAAQEMGTVAALTGEHYEVLYGVTSGLTIASAVALGLAAIGLFGVLSYGAAERTHEFGVRLALGARPSDLARIVFRESATVVMAGATIGAVLAAPVSWLVSQGLTTGRLVDPVLVAVAVSVLGIISLAAATGPIRRVSRITPVGALRAD